MAFLKGFSSFFGKASPQQPVQVLPDGFVLPWTPGSNGRGKLTGYQFTKHTTPGIWIGFQNAALDQSQYAVFFGDGEEFAVLYDIPGPGNEILGVSEFLEKNDLISGGSQIAASLVQGYLDYTAATLNLLHQTPSGHRILEGIIATRQTVIIIPSAAYLGNSYNGGGVTALVWVARQLIDALPKGAMDHAAMLTLVKAATRLDDPAAACALLAAELNALPLYSLFVQNPEYTVGGFLDQFLRFNHAKVSGAVILAWLQETDHGAFAAFLRDDAAEQDGVRLTRYFVSAMIMLLYGRSTPGTSTGAQVQFRVVVNPTDDNDPARSRPPAVGLAHELVHAYNCTVGAQPGLDIDHYSVMLTERICVGLPPFDAIATLTENAVRADWAAVSGGGASVWDRSNPPPRLVYDLVPAEELVATRKRASTP